MNHLRNQSGPAALMCRSQATAGITIEELVVPHVVFPVWIKVQHLVAVVDGSSTVISASKQMLETMLYFFRNMTKMHVVTRACRALHLEGVTIVEMEALTRFNEQEVHGKPDGASPIAVATEKATV